MNSVISPIRLSPSAGAGPWSCVARSATDAESVLTGGLSVSPAGIATRSPAIGRTSRLSIVAFAGKQSYLTTLYALTEVLTALNQLASEYDNTLSEVQRLSKETRKLLEPLNAAWADSTAHQDGVAPLSQELYNKLRTFFYQNKISASSFGEAGSHLPTNSTDLEPYHYREIDLTAMKSAIEKYLNKSSDRLSSLQSYILLVVQTYQMSLQSITNLQELSHDRNKSILQNIRQ